MPDNDYYPGMVDNEAAPSQASDEGTAPEEPGEMEETAEDGKKDEESGGEPTALIPKSLLGGKKFDVGEEVVMKVVHIYGDEVEIAYATGEGGEKKGSMMDQTVAKIGADMGNSGGGNPGGNPGY